MNISEMHTAFRVELDKTTSLSYPSFESGEIDYWLNAGQLKFVLDTLFGNSTNPTNVINSGKNIEDLNSLIVSDPSNTTINDSSVSNGGYIALPSNFLHYISSVIKAGGSGSSAYVANLISNKVKDKFIKTAVNTPWIEQPVVYIDNDVLYYLYDSEAGFTPSSDTIDLKYYKIPQTVSIGSNTDSELPAHTHNEIVRYAVNMALESIESPRYQTNTQILKDQA